MPIVYKDIYTGEEHRQDSFVYIMHEERKIGVPSEYYVATCKEGYRAFGFDFKHLELAYQKSISENNSK